MSTCSIAARHSIRKSTRSCARRRGASGYVKALRGDFLPARELLRASSEEYPLASVGPALLYLTLGDKDRALTSLELACDERAPGIVFLKVDKRFAALRNEPRFQKLLARMHLS